MELRGFESKEHKTKSWHNNSPQAHKTLLQGGIELVLHVHPGEGESNSL